jgi:hypothetical protein
MVKVLT